MKPSGKRQAFTLLEIVLAIAVAGLLLGASAYLVTSLSTIWVLRTEDDSFEEHADGVSLFLQKALDESVRRYQPTRQEAQSDVDDTGETEDEDAAAESGTEKIAKAESASSTGLWKNEGVSMKIIDGENSAAEPKLHFSFFAFPPMLGVTDPPTTLGVEAWLFPDPKQGLLLVWKDIWSIQNSNMTDDEDLLRTSLLSAFVTKVDYLYWDSDTDRWLEYEEPHKFSDAYPVPAFIRLTFTEKDRSVTRILRMPGSTYAMPLF